MSRYAPLILAVVSFLCQADDIGNFGIGFNVSGSGYLRPRVKEVTITQVASGSTAEMAGISVGDSIVSIAGCKIPGCPAKTAKRSMMKGAGEELELELRDQAGQVYNAILVAH